MLFERIESQGLAHYSYIIGDMGQAVVIDPRRDCDIYLELARRAGCRITHILETHRNEDYVVGSVELASRTEAAIWHADGQLDYHYGQPVEDGQTWDIGSYRLRALATPGHTPGSMSYVLHAPNGEPWLVFTGDTLFAGDVGRVDLAGLDLMPELASALYTSLFEKLLPLGDGVIVCPGHGAGSVCGTAIADRPWTTIGWERVHNPKLQYRDRATFEEHVAQVHPRPPYFRRMERYNLEGAPLLGTLPVPPALPAAAFAREAEAGRVLDTREVVAFGAAHIPTALFIAEAALPHYLGWFMPYDVPLFLVTSTGDPTPVTRYSIRLGYDDLAGVLAGGMTAWHMTQRDSAAIEILPVPAFRRRMATGERAWVLDVRSPAERAAQPGFPDARGIYLPELPDRLDDIPTDAPIIVYCNSGARAMLGASLLARAGFAPLAVVLGTLGA